MILLVGLFAVLTLISSYNFVSSDFSPFSDGDSKLCIARLWKRKPGNVNKIIQRQKHQTEESFCNPRAVEVW